MDKTLEQLFFNGINGSTGDYLLSPSTPSQVSQMARPELDEAHLESLIIRNIRDSKDHAGLVAWVKDPNNLAEAGWGVIFPKKDPSKEVPNHKDPDYIKIALKELLEHRKNEAGKINEKYYQEYTYSSSQTANQFLADHHATPRDPADPDKVPYYLLIVGGPEEIPFSFQYQLDVVYAVGRIDFDSLEEYAMYARSVVKAETNPPFLARKARFFGILNEGDNTTKQSTDYLIKPLAEWVNTKFKSQNWDIEALVEQEATKARLSQLLGGSETPALLFTASHGLAFQDSRKETDTGALLCQNWFRGHQGSIPPDWYFAASDISSRADLLGSITFHFACYGAGIPKEDEYGHEINNWKDIAPRAFVAPLPKKLLSRGALAVIGHVDRAWNQSFWWNLAGEQAGPQLSTFQSTLYHLMEGKRIGFALEEMNKRYAALSTDLSEIFQKKQRLSNLSLLEEEKLVFKWTANNDARGYAIIGDPAVRLMVGDNTTPLAERPSLEQVNLLNLLPPISRKPKLEEPIKQQPISPINPLSVISPDEPEIGNSGTSYGLTDTSKQTVESLTKALTQLTAKFASILQQAVDDSTSLEVSTYSSDNMMGVTYCGGKLEGPAKLRAMTRIQFNGNVIICVPENEEGKVDETLWKIHAEMVQQAQTHRAELLKVMVSNASHLLSMLKGV